MKKIYNYSVEKVVPVQFEPKVEYNRRMQWFEFRKVYPWDVIKVVADHFKVSVEDIQSPSRKQLQGNLRRREKRHHLPGRRLLEKQ